MKPDEHHPHLKPSHPEPVAYDADGRPLYAHPSETTNSTMSQPAPQVVYMARPHEPQKPHLSEDVRQKHEESKKHYSYLNLSDGEYVISAIRRHPIGLLGIWGLAGAIILALLAMTLFVMTAPLGSLQLVETEQAASSLALLLTAVVVTVIGLATISTVVYNANRFFLTNESVIQFIQTSLFSKKEQTISLVNIEDASYTQHGILQHIVGYGSLRLSTEGDETTYRFSFVADPRRQVTLLNNAVEAFKNGRPVDMTDD